MTDRSDKASGGARDEEGLRFESLVIDLAIAIDSQGNAWLANTLGTRLSLETKLKLLELKLTGATMTAMSYDVIRALFDHPGQGSVSMLRPDGSAAAGSPFNPGSIWGAWGVAIDGNDHVWVANFAR